jgi:hypothetical protein
VHAVILKWRKKSGAAQLACGIAAREQQLCGSGCARDKVEFKLREYHRERASESAREMR